MKEEGLFVHLRTSKIRFLLERD